MMETKIKLFCIPYAGGSGSSYLKWKPLLSQAIELVPVELAGRGKRFREPLYSLFEEAVDDLYKIIYPHTLDMKYAIFGHSMGSILAYELTYMLFEKGNVLPKHIIFSGRMPPKRNFPTKKHLKSDAEFEDDIIRLGGTERAIIENSELKSIVFPIIKADYKLLDGYKYKENNMKLPMDFSVFYGEHDSIDVNENIYEWADYTNKKCDLYCFSGSHFFINEQPRQVTDTINSILEKYI